MKRIAIACGFVLGSAVLAGAVRAQSPEETKASVPALTAFHDVIYPMWHTAWAERDTAMLRDLWPDIQKHVAAIQKAELPGILRDKKGDWQKGLERLTNAETAYGQALAQGTMDDKLAAAEVMHSAYEGLVRTIRPVMPEVASFHEVLYGIYHYAMPKKDQAALNKALPDLTAQMAALDAAKLPSRLEKRQAEFDKARAALSASVANVARVAPQGDWSKTEPAVEAMHTAYQALEKVFD